MLFGVFLLGIAVAFAVENSHDVDVDFFFDDVTASLSTVIAISAAGTASAQPVGRQRGVQMNVRISARAERLRSSLFFVPMLGVMLAAILGFVFLAVDRRIDTTVADLPLGFSSTVESARTLLGVVAGATISFAGIAFSVSLLIFQLTSSQYSPRAVHTLFRDPFTRRVMALVVGTFTYCLVVLRSVRSAVNPDGEAVIANLSVSNSSTSLSKRSRRASTTRPPPRTRSSILPPFCRNCCATIRRRPTRLMGPSAW